MLPSARDFPLSFCFFPRGFMLPIFRDSVILKHFIIFKFIGYRSCLKDSILIVNLFFLLHSPFFFFCWLCLLTILKKKFILRNPVELPNFFTGENCLSKWAAYLKSPISLSSYCKIHVAHVESEVDKGCPPMQHLFRHMFQIITIQWEPLCITIFVNVNLSAFLL